MTTSSRRAGQGLGVRHAGVNIPARADLPTSLNEDHICLAETWIDVIISQGAIASANGASIAALDAAVPYSDDDAARRSLGGARRDLGVWPRRQDGARRERAARHDPLAAARELDGAAEAHVREAELVLQDVAGHALGAAADLGCDAQGVVLGAGSALGRRHRVGAGGALSGEVRAAQLRQGGGVLGAERAEAPVTGGLAATGAGSARAHHCAYSPPPALV